jgi:phage-related protein
VSGAAGIANQITSQLGVSPLSGVNALTSGIRLSASGLGSLSSVANIPAAAIATAGGAISSISAIPNAATQLAGNVASSISSLPTTAIASVSGLGTSLVNGASALTNDVTNLASKGASAVSGALGNATNAIAGLQNVQTPDIAAIGSKLGIDPSALAGMSPDKVSQMTAQLESVAKNVPDNTDLGSLKDQGISFANLTGDKLKNLPAVQPKVTAPAALTDPALAALLEEKYGSTKSLLAGSANLAPLTDINKVTNPAGILSAGSSLGFGNAQSIVGSIGNANSLINNTIGSAAGIANNVGSLAQNSIQGFSPASIGLGSVESNITNVANLAQSGVPNNLGISVASQFGSLQSSPLAKLVSDNNISGSSSA